jgi:hypothetical protein
LKIMKVIEASPARGFPSEETAVPVNGTRDGIAVGAEAAAGVRGEMDLCPDAAAKDAARGRAQSQWEIFMNPPSRLLRGERRASA